MVTAATSKLLERLSRVRETGPGRWAACCPAHDDKSPSLSVRDAGDILLIHCFGGCSAGEILGAVGLSLRDLYPDGGLESRALRRGQRRIPARDALAAIDREALLVATVASDLRHCRVIDGATWGRLAVAVARIGQARDVAR